MDKNARAFHSLSVHREKRRLILATVLGVASISCVKVNRDLPSQQKATAPTDLGAEGINVANRFAANAKKSSHCAETQTADYRVMVVGFAPFQSSSTNFSGVVAMNFVSMLNDEKSEMSIPKLQPQDVDAILSQGQVRIKDKRVEVCQIMVSVIWDLAGAIVLNEAAKFHPDLIIMSGIDGSNPASGTIEQVANNTATVASGFEGDGSESSVIPIPKEGKAPAIIHGGPEKIRMTWDAGAALKNMLPLIKARLSDVALTSKTDDTPGTYLCNNISYVVLYGLSGKLVSLASDEIKLKFDGLAQTKAGFLHYPGDSRVDSEKLTRRDFS